MKRCISVGIGRHAREAVDAQRVFEAGDEEEQAHAGVAGDVGERIEAVVARPVRHGQRLLVDHVHKARLAAARGHVACAVGAAAAHAEEGRQADEVRKMLVDPGDILAHRPARRFLVDAAQAGFVCQNSHERFFRNLNSHPEQLV